MKIKDTPINTLEGIEARINALGQLVKLYYNSDQKHSTSRYFTCVKLLNYWQTQHDALVDSDSQVFINRILDNTEINND